MIKRLLSLLLVCSGLSFGQIVSHSWASAVGYSTWQLHTSVGGTATHLRMAYATAPTACTSGVLEDTTTDPPGGNVNNMNNLTYNTSGKLPQTTYNVCAQVQFGTGTWVTGPQISITTLSAPAVDIPPHAIQVNTDYPSDIVNNVAVDSYTVASGCTDLSTWMGKAIDNQLTRNSIVNLPVGQANACYAPIEFPWMPRDLLILNIGSVSANALDNYITFTGMQKMGTNQSVVSATDGVWPDGSAIVDGQAVIFGQPTYSNNGFNDTIPGNIFGDGRIYYLRLKDNAAHQYWVYAGKPYSQGGVKVRVWAQGGGHFAVAPWPRKLKNIIVRTATPDDQFAAPGSALGSLNWLPKMTWFINVASNHATISGGGILGWSPPGGTPAPAMSVANIRLVGIAWTVVDDPNSYKTPDPTAWDQFTALPPNSQNIIFDRNAFFMPSVQQRNYTALYFQGTYNAIVNSYFDNLRFFYGTNDFMGGAGLHQ